MLIFILLYSNICIISARDDVKHIGSHKFRFNDEILDLSTNVVNPEVKSIAKTIPENHLERVKKYFKHPSFVKTALNKEPNHTQAIGYTSDTYPNPVTNPQLCVHTFYTKTYVCDPDGILSEAEQEKLNQQVAMCNNKIFVALSHNVFVPTDKDRVQAQASFGEDLLRAYSEASHSDEKNSILISYVKEFQTLRIVVGEDLVDTKLDKEFVSKLEKEFEENQKETYQSLKKVVEGLNSQLGYKNKMVIILACVAVLAFILIWGLVISLRDASGDTS